MANWRVVSKSGPSFEGGSAPSPTNPNNLAAVLDGYTTDKSKVRVKVTFDALTSPTKGLHIHYEDPDHSATAPLATDGTTPADGTHPTLGQWKTYDAGRYTTSPVILEFTAKPARNIRIYGNPYTALNEPALVQAGLTGATPSVVVTIPEVPSGPVGNEYCNDVTGVAFSNHLVYLEGGLYKESVDVTFTPPKDPRWTGVWVQTWIQDPTAGTWKLWAEQGLRKPGTLTYSPTWERLFNAQIRFVSFNDPRTSKPEDDNRNTYIPGFTPTLTLTVGKSDGKTVDGGAMVDGTLNTGAFAAGIEPVGKVNVTPGANGQLPGPKTTSTVYNEYNKKTYRWDAALGKYRYKAEAGDFEADSVTVGIVAAAAIRTRELATDELLVGLGGGKPGKIRVVDAIGSTVASIGYDGTNFNRFVKIRVGYNASDPDFYCDGVNTYIKAACITNLQVSQISGWAGATIDVGSGLSITGNISTYYTSGTQNGVMYAQGGFLSDGGLQAVAKIITFTNFNCGGYDGITGTRTVKDGSGNNKTVTLTGGIITAWKT